MKNLPNLVIFTYLDYVFVHVTFKSLVFEVDRMCWFECMVFRSLCIRTVGSIHLSWCECWFFWLYGAMIGQLWGNEIAEKNETSFLEWATELKDMNLNRDYFSSKLDFAELHFFWRLTGSNMYGCLFQSRDRNGVQLCFVVGRCPIAPMKQQTFAKLELQAALYTARLRQPIIEGHDICLVLVYHWTDSLTVLRWTNAAHRKQQVFLANRIGKVLDCSSVDEWRHVKGTMILVCFTHLVFVIVHVTFKSLVFEVDKICWFECPFGSKF